jgi:hypothetical protein
MAGHIGTVFVKNLGLFVNCEAGTERKSAK